MQKIYSILLRSGRDQAGIELFPDHGSTGAEDKLHFRENRLEITIFLVLFLSFAYFYQGGGANQNARLGQMRAVAEKGQLHLSGLRVPTHDIVDVDGKIYPNKAPGMSLVGIGPYFLISRLKGALIGLFSEDFYHLFSCWLVTVIIVALPCALGGVVFFRLLGLFHEAIAPRLICTWALFLGTPAFAYSTVIYGHMVGSVLTVISFYLLLKYLVLKPRAARGSLYIFLAGLAGGWAVVTEYPTVVIVSMLALFCFLVSVARYGRYRAGAFISLGLGVLFSGFGILLAIRYNLFQFLPLLGEGAGKFQSAMKEAGVSGWVPLATASAVVVSAGFFVISLVLAGSIPRRIVFFVLGLVPPAVILLVYNQLVFGKIFFVAYFDKRAAAHSAYRDGPILGFQTRKLMEAVYQTSFGSFRGFFHLSPFLILLFPGGFYLAREKGFRSLLPVLAILVSGYFLLNTLYPYYYGGKALGPRHAMEMLPYMVLLAFFFVLRFPRISALLAAVSIFLILTATAVRFEEYARHPFQDLYFYSFFGGYLSINPETTFQANTVVSSLFNAFNLGQVAGLNGQLSLMPLYLIWLTGGALMFHFGKKREDNSGAGEPPTRMMKVVWAILAVLLALGVFNFISQLQFRAALKELEGAGAFRISAAQAPAPHIQLRTSPGHRLQVWEVIKPHSPGDTVTVKIQHAASGREGGFYVVAYGDQDGDGRPDMELGRSSLLTARAAGDWSYWTVSAPEGKLFVGNTWNEGVRVFFDRTGWSGNDLSATMHYSVTGPPTLSTGPRSTNMAIEIEPGGNKSEAE